MTTFQEPRFGDFGQPQPAPRRTSIAAIMSLILGILALVTCCIPVAGPVLGGLGLVFAIAAFILVGGSQGRLGGRGLAVGGMVCAIIGIIGGVFVLVGMNIFVKGLGQYGNFVKIAQSDDPSGMTAQLSPAAAQALTPEDIAAFKAQTLDHLGAYQSTAPGLMGFVKGVTKMGQVAPQIPPPYMQSRPGQSSMIPVNAEFEKGGALILLVLDPQGSGPTTQFGAIDNIGVAPDGGGTIIWLLPPPGAAPVSPPTPAPPPAAPPVPDPS